jgi:hypothetical protein
MSEQPQETITVYEQAVQQQIRTVITENPEFFASLAQQYGHETTPHEFLAELADSVLETFFPDEFSASNGDQTLTENLRQSILGGLIASYVNKESLEVFGDEKGIDTELLDTDEFDLMLIQSIAESGEDFEPETTVEG